MTPLREKLANIGTGVAVLATLAMAGTVFLRGGRAQPLPGRSVDPVRQVNNWDAIKSVGHRVGSPGSPLELVVFTDFECPACARFETATLPLLKKRYPSQISVVYRHWPLESHRFAYPAARAAECAAAQGRYEAFHEKLFSEQRRLGLKPFSEMATEVGVKDMKAFDACISDTSAVRSIQADIADITQIGGTGTPAVIVNGWYLPAGASPDRLDSIARAVLQIDRTAR
jgi:protein-disulfide isomerase